MIIFPIGTDRAQRRKPWMNIALIAINLVVFIYTRAGFSGAGAGPFGLLAGTEHFLLYPSYPKLYQFVTYQFLHQDLSHIFFNMLFLYCFGNNLNEKLGHVGYLAAYLAGGILAGLGHVLVSTDPTLGASGAVSAVTGLFLALLPRTHIRLFAWLIFYLDVWEIPAIWFILFSVLKDVLQSVLGFGPHVAYAAHLAGYAAGFGVGMLLLLSNLVPRDHYDLLALFQRWQRRRQYEATVAGGYDPYRPTITVAKDPTAPQPAETLDPEIAALHQQIAALIREHNVPAAAAAYLALKQRDPRAVLAAQDQLDVANQLYVEGKHPSAAEAYEAYLAMYATGPLKAASGAQIDEVTLILGLLYARYHSNTPRAIELLSQVQDRLTDASRRDMVASELARLRSAQ